MSNMVKCKRCGEEMAKGAKVCPSCGEKNSFPFFKKWWFWLIVVIVVLAIIGSLSEDEDNHDGKVKVPITSSSASGKNYEDIVTQFEKAGFENITTKEITDLITGWVNKDGEVESVSIDGDTDYDSNDWFEKDAKVVISYHTFAEEETTRKESEKEKKSNDKKEETTTTAKATEKVTEKQTETTTIAETTTVVETTAAPSSAYDTLDKTTQNAYRAGIDYLNVLNFSRQGLIDQLSSEYGSGYTLEQAQNAVAAIEADGKVDWRQEAVDSANGYLEFMPFSRSELIDQLTSEYGEKFTQEEAEYAVNQVGLQ